MENMKSPGAKQSRRRRSNKQKFWRVNMERGEAG